MNNKDMFEDFQKKMLDAIEVKRTVYGDTWKEKIVENELLQLDFLEQRIHSKLHEFELTKNPDKLISLANLTMLLYCRKVHLND